MRIRNALLAAITSAVVVSPALHSQTLSLDPFPDARDKAPVGWTGPIFKLRQDYPQTLPAEEKYPWKKYDFKKQWKEYLQAVLTYCYEGNVDIDWEIQKNAVRAWYHAPWMHWGRNGREFVHGLTHERASQPGELAQTQTSIFQNWAVGMNNAPGGYVIGQVWHDHNNPNPKLARFPEGTVSCKLLFTQATVEQVPYLKGSKEWQAQIYENTVIPTNPQGRRTIQTVRLLQIDVAVRDSNADPTTGWVFGTFTYDANAPGDKPWERMVPVGIMWGNDPTVTVAETRLGTKLSETIPNLSPDIPFEHLGWAGRLNGPVDNPVSSCLSCHSTAQWPAKAPVIPFRTTKPDSQDWMTWFRNIKAGEPFTHGAESLDYSLQLAVGIQNFYEWQDITRTKGGVITAPGNTPLGLKSLITPPREPNFPFTRGED